MPTIALLAILGCDHGEGSHDEGDPTVTDELTAEEEWEATKEFLCEGGVSVFEVCPCYVTVDWSRLTRDMFGEPIEPATLRLLGMARSSGSVDDLFDDACDEESFGAASFEGYVNLQILGDTSANLGELSFLGTPAPQPQSGQTYMLSWSDEDQPGIGTRMVAVLSVAAGGAGSIDVVWP